MNEVACVPSAATSSARIARQMLVALGVLTLLGGCTPMGIFSAPETLHGNRVDDYRLAELVPGTSTQADVTALIGSPTAKASLRVRGHPHPHRADPRGGQPNRGRAQL
jgi:hypothetical protein